MLHKRNRKSGYVLKIKILILEKMLKQQRIKD